MSANINQKPAPERWQSVFKNLQSMRVPAVIFRLDTNSQLTVDFLTDELKQTSDLDQVSYTLSQGQCALKLRVDAMISGSAVSRYLAIGSPQDQLMIQLIDYAVDGDQTFFFALWHQDHQRENQDDKLSALVELGQAASHIIHEINSPIMVIANKAELISNLISQSVSAERDSKILESAGKISQLIKRTQRIIRDMKIRAHSESGRQFERANIGDLVRDATELCATKLTAHLVDVKVEIPEGLPKIRCSPTRIVQVLVNLISNACDASVSWVNIKVEDTGTGMKLSFVDSGHGIKADVAARLFERSFTTKPVGEGTGLGLAISRQIAVEHGGDLVFDHQKEQTTFVLTLPWSRT